MKTRKKSLYILLAISSVLLTLTIFFVLMFKTASVELSIEDENQVTLEYGVDPLPVVTALYWESVFDQEGTPVEVTQRGWADLNEVGTYTITYSAAYEDEKASATQTIHIQDTTAPTIELAGGEIGYYSPGYTYTEAGFSATDLHDGDLTAQVIRTETASSVSYTVSDSFGNTTTVNRTLECKDIVPPVLELTNGDNIIVAFGSTFADPGFMAFDDVDGDLTASVVVEGSVDTSIYDKQTLTYTVTDSSGNTTQLVRHITIQELTPPVLTLAGEESLFLKLGEAYTEAGYSATDNADGDITSKVVVSGSVDTSKIGIYTITYSATDSSNNTSTRTRRIYVYDPNNSTPNGKVIYLSFDDGPGPYTQRLLDILDKYNVKVTFFVTNQSSKYQNMIGEAFRRGHTIALHTYSHVFSDIYSSEAAYYNDLNKISDICVAQTGVKPSIVRFPGGTSNMVSARYCPGIMSALTRSLPANGYQYCDWNVDSNDAAGSNTAAEVAYNVISAVPRHQNSYVLQHDTKSYSVTATEEIIRWGLANGYTFMPLTPSTPMYHHPARN